MDRYHWARHIAALDAADDAREIYQTLAALEFPWDMNQALSLALFRTYAVPSIGRLLHDTGEFTGRTQKRYDDTALLLDAIGEHGLDHPEGRAAVRRVNQMHRMYAVGEDDLRYVLCTFVVVPMRWLDEFGWRRPTDHEREAAANYYAELGRHMAITDIPRGYRALAEHMDAYEAEYFGYDEGARAVADATLDLLTTFPPNHLLPAAAVRRFSHTLMDDPLLDALGYARPTRLQRALGRGALRGRARVVRRMAPRRERVQARDLPSVRGYEDGYDVRDLGTFTPAAGCPVPRR